MSSAPTSSPTAPYPLSTGYNGVLVTFAFALVAMLSISAKLAWDLLIYFNWINTTPAKDRVGWMTWLYYNWLYIPGVTCWAIALITFCVTMSAADGGEVNNNGWLSYSNARNIPFNPFTQTLSNANAIAVNMQYFNMTTTFAFPVFWLATMLLQSAYFDVNAGPYIERSFRRGFRSVRAGVRGGFGQLGARMGIGRYDDDKKNSNRAPGFGDEATETDAFT